MTKIAQRFRHITRLSWVFKSCRYIGENDFNLHIIQDSCSWSDDKNDCRWYKGDVPVVETIRSYCCCVHAWNNWQAYTFRGAKAKHRPINGEAIRPADAKDHGKRQAAYDFLFAFNSSRSSVSFVRDISGVFLDSRSYRTSGGRMRTISSVEFLVSVLSSYRST